MKGFFNVKILTVLKFKFNLVKNILISVWWHDDDVIYVMLNMSSKLFNQVWNDIKSIAMINDHFGMAIINYNCGFNVIKIIHTICTQCLWPYAKNINWWQKPTYLSSTKDNCLEIKFNDRN